MGDISQAVLEAAWRRSGAYCECTRVHHAHGAARCGAPLEWVNRGRHGEGAWEVRRRDPGGAQDAVEILCWDCHAKDI